MRSKNDVNWLKTIPLAEPSLSNMNLISSLWSKKKKSRHEKWDQDKIPESCTSYNLMKIKITALTKPHT